MVNMAAAVVPEEQLFILSSLSPVGRRNGLPLRCAGLARCLFHHGRAALDPPSRADRRLRPAYATAIFVNDSITAVLLFAQFSILRSRALLAIASGYLFTAFILIPWLLTFPGAFTPGGLLGAGRRHVLLYIRGMRFPMFVIAYAL